MVSDSDAPGMNLSSRSKAAAAAMVGGERRMGVGGGGVSRQRFIKDVGVNRTKKKSGTTPGDDGGKIQQKQQSGTILGLRKKSPPFHSAQP